MEQGLSVWTPSLFRSRELFASRDVDETRSKVATLLNDHALQPQGPALAARAHGLAGDTLNVYLLEYGQPVLVEEKHAAQAFMLVQMVLSGSLSVEGPDGHWTVGPGQGIVLPADLAHRLSWGAHASHLILKIPVGRLNEVYGDLAGEPPRRPLRFSRGIDLGSPDGRHWAAHVRYLCEQAAQPGHAPPFKLRQAEDALMRHLLCAQSSSLHEQLAARPAAAPGQVRRARDFIESHLHEDLCLARLAQHCGTSARSLSRGFQACYATSPMQYLRDRRLDAVWQALRDATPQTRVADVALQWGCTHLGRFAAAYRRKFGESPSETLRASLRRSN